MCLCLRLGCCCDCKVCSVHPTALSDNFSSTPPTKPHSPATSLRSWNWREVLRRLPQRHLVSWWQRDLSQARVHTLPCWILHCQHWQRGSHITFAVHSDPLPCWHGWHRQHHLRTMFRGLLVSRRHAA